MTSRPRHGAVHAVPRQPVRQVRPSERRLHASYYKHQDGYSPPCESPSAASRKPRDTPTSRVGSSRRSSQKVSLMTPFRSADDGAGDGPSAPEEPSELMVQVGKYKNNAEHQLINCWSLHVVEENRLNSTCTACPSRDSPTRARPS